MPAEPVANSPPGTATNPAPASRPPLVQQFNGFCLKYGVTGVAKGNHSRDARRRRQHSHDPNAALHAAGTSTNDQRWRALRRMVDRRMAHLAQDERFQAIMVVDRDMPFSAVLVSIRNLCTAIESELALSPPVPAVAAPPQPFRTRMQRYAELLDKAGVADALAWNEDSNTIRFKIYVCLSQVDPHFALNEPEYTTLLCRADFALDSVMAEIDDILQFSDRAFSPKSWQSSNNTSCQSPKSAFAQSQVIHTVTVPLGWSQ